MPGFPTTGTCTWLFNHAKDIASLFIDEFGCNDPAVVVAAVMGDVNYKSAHQPAWYRLVSWLLYRESTGNFDLELIGHLHKRMLYHCKDIGELVNS